MNQDDRDEIGRELRLLGERFVAHYNALATKFENSTDDELEALQALPTIERLEAIEAFSRSLTTQPPWSYAPPQDRAYMAEIRCIISDAVWNAKVLDYSAATECVQRAMRKLAHVRDRSRTGKYRALPRELVLAIDEAATVMMDVVHLFMESEKSLGDGQVVGDDSLPTR